MTDPARWADGAADAPTGATDLLSAASPPPPLDPALKSAMGAKLAAATAAGTAVAVAHGAWWGWKGLAVLAVVGASAAGVGVATRARTTVDTPQRATAAPTPATQRANLVATAAPVAASATNTVIPPTIAAPTAAPDDAQRAARETVTPANRAARSAPCAVSFPDEVAFISRVTGLVRARPRDALALLEAHERDVPAACRPLAIEHERLAIEALMAVGRRAEAVRRGRAFLAAHRHDLHADRIRDLIGSAP